MANLSYSFHISAKGHALKTVQNVADVDKHNERKFKSDKYNKEHTENLRGSDSLLGDVKQVYHEQFDEAVEKFNSKQKRDDRKIDDYLQRVSDSRNDVAVEIIIQVGDRDFWGDKPLHDWMQMHNVFKDQLAELEELCPDFKIANASVHYDEKGGSPHMHVVGVPVVECERGMERQCIKTKVFTKESLAMLQDKMRESMERSIEYLQAHQTHYSPLFADFQLKEKKKGRNKDIPKESLDEFYALEAEKEELRTMITAETERLEDIIGQQGDVIVDLQKAETRLDSLSEDIKGKEAYKSTLESEITALEDKMDSMQADRRNLLEKFVEHSHIKPIFESWCGKILEQIKRNREEQRAKNEKFDGYGMAYWKADDAKYSTKSVTSNEQMQNIKDENERE